MGGRLATEKDELDSQTPGERGHTTHCASSFLNFLCLPSLSSSLFLRIITLTFPFALSLLSIFFSQSSSPLSLQQEIELRSQNSQRRKANANNSNRTEKWVCHESECTCHGSGTDNTYLRFATASVCLSIIAATLPKLPRTLSMTKDKDEKGRKGKKDEEKAKQ